MRIELSDDDIHRYKQQITELQAELAAGKQELINSVHEMGMEIAELKGDKRLLQAERDALQRELSASAEKAEGLQAHVERLRKQLASLHRHVQIIDKEYEKSLAEAVVEDLLKETPEQSLKALTDWKDIVIEMLITSHIYRKEHEDNPRQAIIDLIHWDNHIALDPQVSSAAQALKDKGWNEAIDAVLDLEGYVVQDSPDSMTVAIGKKDIRELRREVDDD